MIVWTLSQPGYRTLVRVRQELPGSDADVTIATMLAGGRIIEIIRQLTLLGGIDFSLVRADITQLDVDAIVNAANTSLQHGGGVAAAIVQAGGAVIQTESNRWVQEHGEINAGHPALTSAGAMPARFVIHAVGPIWGEGDERSKLEQAVTGVLKLADDHEFTSLAFPAISTGIYRFPLSDAADVILGTIARFAQTNQVKHLRTIILALWGQAAAQAFSASLDQMSIGGEFQP